MKKYCAANKRGLDMNSLYSGALLIVTCLSVIFFGCANRMQLDQAKDIAISIRTKSFVPPPRRIDDIIAKLNSIEPNAQVLQANIHNADLQPDGIAKDDLWKFYRKRGRSARLVGRPQQMLEDFRMSYKNASHLSMRGGRREIARELALAECDAGNFYEAIRIISAASNEMSNSIGNKEVMAQIFAQIGDVQRAKSAAYDAIALMSNIKTDDPPAKHREPTLNFIILEAAGKWGEAEKYINQSMQKYLIEYGKKGSPLWVPLRKLVLARNLLHQNRIFEAESVARESLLEILEKSGKESVDTVQAIMALAEIYYAQSRFDDTEQLSIIALNILNKIGASDAFKPGLMAHLLAGKSLLQKRDIGGAFKHFNKLFSATHISSDTYFDKISHDLCVLISLIQNGRHEDVLPILQKDYGILTQRYDKTHPDVAELQALIAIALLKKGDSQNGLKMFQDSIKILCSSTKINTTAISKIDKIYKIRFIIDSYIEQLTKKYNVTHNFTFDDNIFEALSLTEFTSVGIVQKAISAVTLRNIVGTNSELANLIRQKQDIDSQLEVFDDNLSGFLLNPSSQQFAESIDDINNERKKLKMASEAIEREIENRTNLYGNLLNHKRISISEVKKLLKPNEALVCIYATDIKTYVWSLTNTGTCQFHVVDLSLDAINKILTQLRKSLNPNLSTLGDIPPYDTKSAYELYARLLKPIELSLKNVSNLLIISNGPIAHIPFSALPTANINIGGKVGPLFAEYKRVPWLIKKFSITMFPTLSSFMSLRSLPDAEATRKMIVGFADPIFSIEQITDNDRTSDLYNYETKFVNRGSNINIRSVRKTKSGSLDNNKILSSQLSNLNRLPDTAEELVEVARTLNADLNSDLFLGKNASRSKVMSMDLTDRSIIYFATHALIPGDIDGLDQPAIALSSPSITGIEDDGLLTMGDIFQLKLNADWVILSACNTAAGSGKGDEAISGLGRSFFYAGTRSLLVSLWPVESSSAKNILTNLFLLKKADQELTRSQALRKSMLNLLDNENIIDVATGKIVSSYAHPFFWSPFIVVGEPSWHQTY